MNNKNRVAEALLEIAKNSKTEIKTQKSRPSRGGLWRSACSLAFSTN